MSHTDDPEAVPPSPHPLVSTATSSALHRVVYPPNTILFHEHDADDRLYIILSGRIALVSGLGTTNEQLVAIRTAGEVLGEMSVFLPNQQHLFSARVQAAAEVLLVDRAALDDVLRREPLLARELVRVASTIMQQAFEFAMHAFEEKHAQLTEAYRALEQAQARLVQQERIEHELRLAREIQEGMLPTTMPEVSGIDFGVRSIPAYEVGGDFVDVFVLDDETLGVVIGDTASRIERL